MKKYILTSQSFTGSVEFGFNLSGELVYYLNASEMSYKQIEYLLMHLPLTEAALPPLSKTIKGALKVLPADLSFETFWETYDKKINRKRVEPMWKKLSDAEKMQAIMNVKPYDSYLYRTGIGKLHPDNYLKREYYLVDWKREK